MYNKSDIKSYVPRIMRKRIDPVTLAAVLAQRTADWSLQDSMNYISGAVDVQEQLSGEKPEHKHAHYKSPLVEEVRIFNRMKDGEYILGTKARIYHIGNNIDTKEEETQSIDTGFMTYSGHGYPGMTYQNAQSKSCAYEAISAIGGRMAIDKITRKTEGSLPNRWAANLVRENSDIPYPKHVIDSLLLENDETEDFFTNEEKDYILGELLNATDVHDATRNIVDYLELDSSVYDEIIESSNSQSQNLSTNKDRDFNKSPGINLVNMMGIIIDNC